MATGAATLKKVTLELGGNDPAIVLPDVDVTDAAPKIFQGAMNNSGQVHANLAPPHTSFCLYDAIRLRVN